MSQSALENMSKEELIGTVLNLHSELSDVRNKFGEIQLQLDWFKKQLFGEKSEKRISEPNSNQLMLGELLSKQPPAPEPEIESITYTRKKHTKGKLPGAVDDKGLRFDSNVPVKLINIPNPDINGLIEGKDYEVISADTTSQLAQIPASYVVLRYKQKTVKIKETGKLTTDTIKPRGVFEKSYADVSLVANLLIDKFLYHLPLYRQHQRIGAAGILVSRASLTNFIHRACDLLEPIHKAQLQSIREGSLVSIDETPIKAGHSKSKQKMKKGYFWSVYGNKDEVLFHYSPSRAKTAVKEILGDDFKGTALTDGYEVYSKYCKELSGVEHAECWSHTRRHFLKAEKSHPDLVSEALQFIRSLYSIEDEIKELKELERLKVRGERSKLIVDQCFEWLKGTFKLNSLLPTDEFTKAANYALKREKELRVFLGNPDLPIDTNHLERQIRPVAVGRKNWLFCWTEVGAKYAAIAYSLIATCKLHDVNIYDYLVDVLQRVELHPQKDVHLLTPRLWKENFQDEKLISALDWNPEHISG